MQRIAAGKADVLGELMEAVRRSAKTGVLAPIAAVRDYAQPSKRASWGGPLNGQSFRRLIVESLVAELATEQIIETGTFRGTSTELFAEFAEVWTVEASPRFFWYSWLRLRRRDNVHLLRGDSRARLRDLSRRHELTRARTLFYLDAHWGPDLPLADELLIAAEAWPSWVAVIDDFRVPGDEGYGYDAYSPEATLEEAYLRANGPAGLRVFYPRLPSRLETGRRRGCAVVTTVDDVAARLRGLPDLLVEAER